MEATVISFKMAERLRQLREEAKLTHERLHEQLEETVGVSISRDSLLKYEVAAEHHTAKLKNMGMRVEFLIALATFYGVSTEYILGLTDIRSPLTDIRIAARTTGLCEMSIARLRNLHKLQEDFQDDADDFYSFPAEINGKPVSTTSVIDDFIEFVAKDIDDSAENFFALFSFLYACAKHAEKIEQIEHMSLEERENDITRHVLSATRDAVQGTISLNTAETATHYRRSFCDSFSDFLKEKYPCNPYPKL